MIHVLLWPEPLDGETDRLELAHAYVPGSVRAEVRSPTQEDSPEVAAEELPGRAVRLTPPPPLGSVVAIRYDDGSPSPLAPALLAAGARPSVPPATPPAPRGQGPGWPEHYGDPIAEHLAVRRAAGLASLAGGTPGVAIVRGRDWRPFLHALLAADILALASGTATPAVFLTAKGKLITDLTVIAMADHALLFLPRADLAQVLVALERYHIREDIELEDAADSLVPLALAGPASSAIVEALLDPGARAVAAGAAEAAGAAVVAGAAEAARPPQVAGAAEAARTAEAARAASVRLIAGDRGLFVPWADTGERGFLVLARRESVGEIWNELLEGVLRAGGRAVGSIALETLRVEAGIPALGRELDATTLPQEAGIDFPAISSTKGCYVGQEVMARIQTQGHVNRRLVGLLCERVLPEPGDTLAKEGRDVGKVTSAIMSPSLGRPVALGYVRRDAALEGNDVTVKGARGEDRARIASLPLVKPGAPAQ